MMIANQLSLTRKQINSFDRFLVDGTGKALNALETMFALNIVRSDSTIEIATGVNSEFLKHLGSGPLYIVSSVMEGDMQGSILLLLRSGDFKYLGEVVRPVLSLIYLSSPDIDLATLDSQKPDWTQDDDTRNTTDEAFHEQMMDLLAEMGNVLFGLYTIAMYKICNLNTHHSVPEALRDPDQQALQQVLSSTEEADQLHLVIENEFVVMDRTIKLWCLISPTQGSFQDMLNKIECLSDYQDQGLFRPAQNSVAT